MNRSARCIDAEEKLRIVENLEGLAMSEAPDRIDGWKAIAAHFRRDRTTVMRWARQGDLPVRRMPGQGSASVYAYTHELDSWLAKADAPQEPHVFAPLAAESIERRRFGLFTRPVLIGLSALTIVGVFGVPYALQTRPAPVTQAAPNLPADPAVAEIYLRAREDWASRTADGLHRAIAGFGVVASRDPKFAPAYTGMADAYLLVREFDAMPDAKAYPQAEAAAKAALVIDPTSADAHRALAFVDYYWRRDNAAARTNFTRALQLDPVNAQTHFWFGNALVDNGEAEAGLHELKLARLLDPGSRAIQTDYDLALWQTGQRRLGRLQLKSLADGAPQTAAPHAYLAVIHLVERDYAGYLDENVKRAELRGDPALAKRSADERAAFSRGGGPALLDVMMSEAIADRAQSASPDSAWAAAVTALGGDRPRLLEILRQADAKGEHWGSSGWLIAVFNAWRDDPEIAGLVARRKGESLLPPSRSVLGA